jgi:hypothetical protein
LIDLADLSTRANIDGMLLISRWSLYESGNAWDQKNNWLVRSSSTGIRSVGPRQNREALAQGISDLVQQAPAASLVAILQPVPQPSFDAGLRAHVNKHFGRPAALAIDQSEHERQSAGFRAVLDDLRVVFGDRLRLYDPAALLCQDSRCLAADGDYLYYSDGSHLTALGVERLKPLLRSIVADLARESPP